MPPNNRQVRMLKAFGEFGYIHVGLSELVDEDFNALHSGKLIRVYSGIGASRIATLTTQGRQALSVLDPLPDLTAKAGSVAARRT